MAEQSSEVEALLRELRAHLANSNDPWESRRELIMKINGLVPGGETDLMVGSIREMVRMGASWTSMLQTFNQFFPGQATGASFADLFTKSAPVNPFMASPAAFDFFRQMSEFLSSQANAFTKSEKK